MWRLNGAIMDRFVELSRADGFALVIMFLPGDRDTPRDQERRRWLAAFARTSGLPFRDLSEIIHARPRKDVFIRRNWHLNPTGHALVAEALRDLLVEAGLVTPTESETPR